MADFPGLRPEKTWFRVQRAGGPIFSQLYALALGAPAEIDFDLSSGGTLLVKLVPTEEQPLPAGGSLLATYLHAAGGWSTQELAIPRDGELRLVSLTGEVVSLQVLDARGEGLATRTVTLLPGTEQEVELPLDARRATLRVLDPGGAPLAGTKVELYRDSREAFVWQYKGQTDARGELAVGPLPEPDLLLSLSHPDAGRAFNLPVHLGGDPGDPLEVVLDASASIQLRCVDGEVPLASLGVLLYDSELVGDRARDFTDAGGRVAFGSIAEGTYWLLVRQEGYWPVLEERTATPGGELQELQVRRLGGLRLIVADEQGVPASGVGVALESVEFGADVADWIEEGRIEPPEQGLQTGEVGTLELAGLPRGDYRWRIDLGGGVALEGSVTVPAGQLGMGLVYLP